MTVRSLGNTCIAWSVMNFSASDVPGEGRLRLRCELRVLLGERLLEALHRGRVLEEDGYVARGRVYDQDGDELVVREHPLLDVRPERNKRSDVRGNVPHLGHPPDVPV